MKKLRMIVTSVIVLAIVGSAFAFNAKKMNRVCYSTLDNDTCDAILVNKAISFTGQLFHYYQGWRGLDPDCYATNNQNCRTTVRLIDDTE